MSRGGGAAGGSPVSDRLQAQALKAQTPLLSMGICQAGHYLHLFLAHHPPLVCATLILLLLGLSGLGLGGFLLTHRTDLHSPDISQDWVSLRSFGQLALCPVNGTVTRKGRGSHVVGLLATLNFGDGPDRNKTQTFQAQVQGSPCLAFTCSMASELTCICLAFILLSSEVTVPEDKIDALIKAAGVNVEPFCPGLFAKALANVNI
ncbi:hypothetical protein M91_14702 [Bos mutus]|uniref:Large ribosomal subunit protein P1 n=1 Tax=Bos mutus TaxID=72004 RepID=L8IVD4_9CETA|nr:hypothetical protein M91_14702 [Bos mutus]